MNLQPERGSGGEEGRSPAEGTPLINLIRSRMFDAFSAVAAPVLVLRYYMESEQMIQNMKDQVGERDWLPENHIAECLRCRVMQKSARYDGVDDLKLDQMLIAREMIHDHFRQIEANTQL